MNKTVEDIIERRSIRSYLDKPVEHEKLELIAKAGSCAPSGRNLQSAIIVVVENKDDVRKLAEINSRIAGTDSDTFYGAPAVIVVLAKADSNYVLQDGSLVMGNLMNAAHALGLGSCWIHRAKETFELDEGKALLKKWGIEGNYTGVANCIVGYSAEKPLIKPRKENYIYFVK